MLFAGVVSLAAAVGLAVAFGLRESGISPDVLRAAPEVARVVCEGDGARLAAPVVRAGEDGVRFVVENPSSAQLLQVRRDGRGSATAELVLANGAPSEATFAIGPGAVLVACLPDRASAGTPGSKLTIVDPADAWVSPELACSRTETRRFPAPLTDDDEGPVETTRRTLPGVAQADEIAKPGYPGTRWHGDLVVVIRDGATIGRVTRAHDQGMWSITVTACAGSELAVR